MILVLLGSSNHFVLFIWASHPNVRTTGKLWIHIKAMRSKVHIFKNSCEFISWITCYISSVEQLPFRNAVRFTWLLLIFCFSLLFSPRTSHPMSSVKKLVIVWFRRHRSMETSYRKLWRSGVGLSCAVDLYSLFSTTIWIRCIGTSRSICTDVRNSCDKNINK